MSTFYNSAMNLSDLKDEINNISEYPYPTEELSPELVSEATISLVNWSNENILRRKKELEADLQAVVRVEHKTISSSLANVPGINRHLKLSRLSRLQYEQQTTVDPHGHGIVTRAELHRRTPPSRR